MKVFLQTIILLYSVFIIGCSDNLVYNDMENSVSSVSAAAKTGGQSSAGIESGIFQGINSIRQKHGAAPLKHDSRLDKVARDYSKVMAGAGAISHVDAQGNRLEDRLENNGIVDWTQAGENLASSTAGAEPVQAALWGWQRSPGHMENLLLPTFVYTGIGAYRDPVSGEVFITQLFLKP